MKFKGLFKINDNTYYETRIPSSRELFKAFYKEESRDKMYDEYKHNLLSKYNDMIAEARYESTYLRHRDLYTSNSIIITLEDDYAWYLKTPRYLINFL